MTPEQRHEIIHRFYSGHSMRGIARDLQLSRHTVSRVLRRHTVDRREGRSSANSPVAAASRTSKLDAHDAKIRHLLERYPKITSKRILEEIRADGYHGGYRAVRRAIPLAQVLALLDYHPTRQHGRKLRGPCLLCQSVTQRRHTSQTQTCFSADLARSIWHCFRCQQGGDQLTLWSLAQHQPLYAATQRLCQLPGLPIPWLD